MEIRLLKDGERKDGLELAWDVFLRSTRRIIPGRVSMPSAMPSTIRDMSGS